jgi:hypothetical protein
MVLKLNIYKETFKIIGRRNQRKSWAWYSCVAGQTGLGTEGRIAERGYLQVRQQMCPKQKLNCPGTVDIWPSLSWYFHFFL